MKSSDSRLKSYLTSLTTTPATAMQDFEQNATSTDKLLMVLGSVVGGTVSLMVIKNASPAQAGVICSLVTACLAIACSQLTRPSLWWTAVGAIAGILIGTSAVLSETLADIRSPVELRVRLAMVGLQGLAGLIAGMLLGRKRHNPHIPSLRTFISRLSALTVGMFAVNVTVEFIVAGLEEARTLSSRLSTSSTILITALVIPSLVGYLLTERDSS